MSIIALLCCALFIVSERCAHIVAYNMLRTTLASRALSWPQVRQMMTPEKGMVQARRDETRVHKHDPSLLTMASVQDGLSTRNILVLLQGSLSHQEHSCFVVRSKRSL